MALFHYYYYYYYYYRILGLSDYEFLFVFQKSGLNLSTNIHNLTFVVTFPILFRKHWGIYCIEIRPCLFLLSDCQSANIICKRTTRRRIVHAVDKAPSNPNQSIHTNRFIHVPATCHVTCNNARPHVLRAALLHGLMLYADHINYLHRVSEPAHVFSREIEGLIEYIRDL
jgi:hypothetical protein